MDSTSICSFPGYFPGSRMYDWNGQTYSWQNPLKPAVVGDVSVFYATLRDYHRNLKKKKIMYVRGPGGLNCILCLESHKAELISHQKSPEKYPRPCLLQFWKEFVFHLVLAVSLLSQQERASLGLSDSYRKLSDFFCPKLARTLWF